jgi:predicted nucleic acid-binding protein
MLDTNILILRRWIDPAELPDEMAMSAITLAELSAGPHEVRRNDEQAAYDEHAERARRLEILQRAESEFIPSSASSRSPGRLSPTNSQPADPATCVIIACTVSYRHTHIRSTVPCLWWTLVRPS